LPGGGRPPPRAHPGDQAPVGDRRVPRSAPPAQPAGARPAHEDERAHAQGPEEDRRARQEGGEVMNAATFRIPRTLRGAANLRIAADLRPCAAWFSRPQSTRATEGG